MGQVTIYLESAVEKKVRAAARAEKLSLSKWVARRIEQGTRSEWPEHVRKLAGAWPDMPTVEQIRAGYGKDVKRSRL